MRFQPLVCNERRPTTRLNGSVFHRLTLFRGKSGLRKSLTNLDGPSGLGVAARARVEDGDEESISILVEDPACSPDFHEEQLRSSKNIVRKKGY